MALESDALVILAVLLCPLIIYSVNYKRSLAPLPPGPRKLPILGNLFNVPRTNAHITYKNWGQEYSDFIGVTLNSKSVAEPSSRLRYPTPCCSRLQHDHPQLGHRGY